MDFITPIITALFSALIMPLQLLFIPIDNLLKNINGIEVIPSTINAVASFVGSIPQTIVNLFGINPLLWNITFLIFILYIGLAPTINGVKKIIAWIT